MRHRNRVQQWSLLGLGTLLILVMSSPLCLASQTLSVTPPVLKINSLFGGAEISVSAELPEGSQAVIEVIGKEIEEDMMRKGRHWDLWMNMGEIDIDGAPFLYLLMNSSPQTIVDGNPPWGYEALRKGVSFKGRFRKEERPELFREFIQLKEGHRLYGIFPGAVKISRLKAARSMARATFHLPSRVPQGSYRVCLTVIQEGQITERRCTPFKVVMTGLPAFLTFLSSKHTVLYGLLSICVAVAGGFLSGFLFRPRRKGRSREAGH